MITRLTIGEQSNRGAQTIALEMTTSNRPNKEGRKASLDNAVGYSCRPSGFFAHGLIPKSGIS
jgi:hypothetical protein